MGFGFLVGLVFVELVSRSDDAVVLVGNAFGGLVFVAFGIGFHVVGEELHGLVELAEGGLVVLAQPELTGFLHEVVESGDFLVVELFLLFGFGQLFLGELVVGEDFDGRLKLHDGGIEVVLGEQRLTLTHGRVEGILLVLAFLQDGTHGSRLSAHIFVFGEDLQSGFVFC